MTTYSIKTFDDLTGVDVYHILKARSQVFVVEQQCPYQDMDELDFDCLHLVAHENDALVGYCRIIPPKVNTLYTQDDIAKAAIGRVLVLPEYRGKAIAQQIMNTAIKHCRKKYGKKPIVIAAQTYLIDFYTSLGFEPVGERFLEDNIEHILMVLHLKKPKPPKVKGETNKSAVILQILLLVMSVLFVAGVVYLMV